MPRRGTRTREFAFIHASQMIGAAATTVITGAGGGAPVMGEAGTSAISGMAIGGTSDQFGVMWPLHTVDYTQDIDIQLEIWTPNPPGTGETFTMQTNWTSINTELASQLSGNLIGTNAVDTELDVYTVATPDPASNLFSLRGCRILGSNTNWDYPNDKYLGLLFTCTVFTTFSPDEPVIMGVGIWYVKRTHSHIYNPNA